MKIAFDEHVPPLLVTMFAALSSDEKVLAAEFVSARHYGIPNAKSDVPWLERFAADGGRVVISGDKRMRGDLFEQAALQAAGFVTFFFAPRWNDQTPWDRAANLVKWWPHIEQKIRTASPGEMFEIPYAFQGSELRNVTPPAPAARKKPGRRKSGPKDASE